MQPLGEQVRGGTGRDEPDRAHGQRQGHHCDGRRGEHSRALPHGIQTGPEGASWAGGESPPTSDLHTRGGDGLARDRLTWRHRDQTRALDDDGGIRKSPLSDLVLRRQQRADLDRHPHPEGDLLRDGGYVAAPAHEHDSAESRATQTSAENGLVQHLLRSIGHRADCPSKVRPDDANSVSVDLDLGRGGDGEPVLRLGTTLSGRRGSTHAARVTRLRTSRHPMAFGGGTRQHQQGIVERMAGIAFDGDRLAHSAARDSHRRKGSKNTGRGRPCHAKPRRCDPGSTWPR